MKPRGVDFDTTSLAYECLRGYIHMRHKSMAHYTDIMCDVMRRYNVPLVVEEFHMESGGVPWDAATSHTKLSAKEVKEMEKALADSVRYPAEASKDVLSDRQAMALKLATSYGKTGTAEQKQQLHVYAMVTERYGIPASVTCGEEFYEEYIGTFVLSESDNMVKQFYALQRFHRSAHLTVAELHSEYIRKQIRLDNRAGSSIALHNSRQHQFYQPAMTVSRLLDHLAGAVWRAKVVAREPLELKMSAFCPGVVAWAKEMKSDEYYSNNAMMGIRPSKGDAAARRVSLIAALEQGGDTSNPTLTATNFVKMMLKKGFGLALKPNKGDSKNRRKPLDYTKYAQLVDTYKAGCMRRVGNGGEPMPEFAFLPDDEISYKVKDRKDEEDDDDDDIEL